MDAEALAALRQHYTQGELDETSVPENPLELFSLWFDQACQSQILEPNAMSLATASASGETTLRTVLLKGYDALGFRFFTNFQSTKAHQIADNPRVSLMFPWLLLERQVIVNGVANRIGQAEALKYFVSRPVDSQIGAWASPQSTIITTRKLLEMKFAEMKRKFQEGQIPLPSFWGGYCVKPLTMEFWQGRPSRLHDRIQYVATDAGTWERRRLAP